VPRVPKPHERSTEPKTLLPLPDPTTLGPDIVELGTLDLPVRAAARTTLAEVASRLLPHGGVGPYVPPRSYATYGQAPPDHATAQLHIGSESVFAWKSNEHTGYVSTHKAITTAECGYDSSSEPDDDDNQAAAEAGAAGGPSAAAAAALRRGQRDKSEDSDSDPFVSFLKKGGGGAPDKDSPVAINLMLRRAPRREGQPAAPTSVVHRVVVVDVTGGAPITEHAVKLKIKGTNKDLIDAVQTLLASGAANAAGAGPSSGSGGGAFVVLESRVALTQWNTPDFVWPATQWLTGLVSSQPTGTRIAMQYGTSSEILQKKLARRETRPRYFVFTGLPVDVSVLAAPVMPAPQRFAVVWLRRRYTRQQRQGGRKHHRMIALMERSVFGMPLVVPIPADIDPNAGSKQFEDAMQSGVRHALAFALVDGEKYEKPLLTRCSPCGTYNTHSYAYYTEGWVDSGSPTHVHGYEGYHDVGMDVDEDGYARSYRSGFYSSGDDEDDRATAVKGEDDEDDELGGGAAKSEDDAIRLLRGSELLLTHPVGTAARGPPLRAVFIAATWPKGSVEKMFNTKALANFTLAPSALADGDGDNRALQHAKDRERRISDPQNLWRELKETTTVKWTFVPPSGNAAILGGLQPAYWYQNTPVFRYTQSIVPDAPGSPTGVLRIRLFCCRATQPVVPFYGPPVVIPTPPCNYLLTASEENSNHSMHSCVNILNSLWRNSSAAFRRNELLLEVISRECQERVHELCTLPGLLQACVTGELTEAAQPPGLSVTLRPYQKQALHFCMNNETGSVSQLFWTDGQLADGTRVWYNSMQHRLCLSQPPQPRGGFLCLDMGLGKTVCTLALVLAAPQTAAEAAAAKAELTPGMYASSASLVVCAVSLVGQWIAEAKSKLSSESSLRIHMYHGQGREKNASKLAKDFDLVVTTYETLGADFGKHSAKVNTASLFPPLGAIHWHRIILDESHSVGSPNVGKTLACIRLHGSRRWCVTGTPCGNSIGELQGQLAFLRAHPWTETSFFNPHAQHVFGTTGNRYGGTPETMLYTLRFLMVRHTKTQTLGGKAVLELPPKTEITIQVELSAGERKAYNTALAEAKSQFARILANGPAAVSQQLLAIMSLLLPLRRICSGGALTSKDMGVPDLATMDAARAAAKAASDALKAQAKAAALAAAMAAANAAAAWNAGGYAAGDEKKKFTIAPAPPAAGPSTAAAAAAPPAPPAGAPPAVPPPAADDDAPLDAKPVLPMVPVGDETCNLCGELCDDPVRTGCMHWFCKDCFLESMPARLSAAKCPKCKRAVTVSGLVDEAAVAAAAAAAQEDDDDGSAGAAAATGPSTAAPPAPKAKNAAPPAPKAKKAAPKAKAMKAIKPKSKGKRKARSDDDYEDDNDDDDDEEEEESDDDSDSGPGPVAAKSTRADRAAKHAAKHAAPAAGAGAGAGAAAAAAPAPAPAPGKAPLGPVAITCESKLRALLKELTKMRAADESHKALVFSQFIGTLEWLKTRLPEEGFSYRTISGSMPLPQRAKAIQAFQADPPTTVFLLSVRSGAVGINLTSASHVFVLEPLLNPALEAQAIGRAWRMGQTRSVKVIHFVTKDSVEERIVELNAQRAKAKGANEGGNAAAELAKKKGKQRITVTEVAGAIRADKQDLRAEELQLLFS